ncbi:hypothetical protein BU23DRAFT_569305 [Bimuria novae-zelandiae CBS 107.79]|uniref:Uncharacterized protein n=1 Tax=Bimuria novae-zelandiae CBS 107.79 TaxID=1447943 RepID=A0A6A5V3P0_9PLEO|nr:hypothetical protein BU23DRAFT_569305 [Bimuria novae-zelandiae CBS 107.79]
MNETEWIENVDSADSKSPVEIVKEVAERQRYIFHGWLESEGPLPGSRVEMTVGARKLRGGSRSRDINVYLVSTEYNTIPNKFPEGLLPKYRMGFLKWDECETTVQTFLPLLRTQLERQLPSIKVEWLVGNLMPRHIFAGLANPLLQMTLITLRSWSPRPTHSIMACLGVRDPLHIHDKEIDSIPDASEVHELRKKHEAKMRKLCMDVDWAEAEQMSPGERRLFVTSKAQRMLDEEAERAHDSGSAQ